MLIFRYLTREVFTVLIAITGIMIFVVTMSQLSLYLAAVARGALAFSYLGKVLLYNIPVFLGYILPFAFYLSLLFAYGRLYAESEMVVMQSSGMSNIRLLTYNFMSASVITLFSIFLILWLNPILVRKSNELLNQSGQLIVQTVVAGQFHVSSDGTQIFYVAGVSRDHSHFNDVFIARLNNQKSTISQTNWDVSFSSTAHQVKNPNGYNYLQADNGYAYSGTPGALNFRIAQYTNYQALLQKTAKSVGDSRINGMTLKQLWAQHDNVKFLAEIQWRISLVLQVLILTFIAIPLTKVSPREGRYANFLPALMLYVVYIALLFFARFLMEAGKVPPNIGLWWVHGVMLVILFSLYIRRKS
jgi:lipopolysaccharide export system permease protein